MGCMTFVLWDNYNLQVSHSGRFENKTKFNVQEQGSLGRQRTIITSNAVKQTVDNLKT